jgi:hypothetical protein
MESPLSHESLWLKLQLMGTCPNIHKNFVLYVHSCIRLYFQIYLHASEVELVIYVSD